MKKQHRVEKIIEYLNVYNLVTVEELVKILDVSPATIRRDLIRLDEQGVISRTHGCISLNRFVAEQPTTNEKIILNIREKQLIAEAAMSFVKPGNSIILDAGTTSMALARHFIGMPLQVITVDLHIALFLAEFKQIEVMVVGGKVDYSSQSTIGEHGSSLLRNINPDLAFLSCNSWNLEHGVTTPTNNKSALKQDLILGAAQKILIADSSKYGKYSLFKVTDLIALDHIITDVNLPSKIQTKLAQSGINVAYV